MVVDGEEIAQMPRRSDMARSALSTQVSYCLNCSCKEAKQVGNRGIWPTVKVRVTKNYSLLILVRHPLLVFVMGPGGLTTEETGALIAGKCSRTMSSVRVAASLRRFQTLRSTTNLKTPHNKLCSLFPRIRYLPYRPNSFIKEADKLLMPVFPSLALKKSEKRWGEN